MDSTLTDSTLTRSPGLDPTPRPVPVLLAEGTVLAGRFTLESLAGRGGMGAVYRAVDSLTGQPVALKLLLSATGGEAHQRFTREAELLATLRHPGIVAHVAHGLTEHGQPYLAMEWLEGEDLARRLARQPLTLQETLALVRRAADALAVAHQHGIVHRDIKPSNLFLRHGRPEDMVLLDFGLARHVVPSMAMTVAGMVLGTPGYMAPEQASSGGGLTHRADLFSLGCVLYECLTGQPPFSAPHFAAVLAKILFTEPASLRTLRPELPGALHSLVERLLAKEPQHRPASARALLQELEALEPGPEANSSAPAHRSRVESLTEIEPRLVSVLLASPTRPVVAEEDATLDTTEQRELRDSLRTLLAPYGARLELLADGSVLVTLLLERGSATDQAALAARCALTLKERWPEATVALATGPGVLRGLLPLGEAMDRAGQLLLQLEQLPASHAAHVVLDEVTAGLLGPTFHVERVRQELHLLHSELLSVDETRPLLGRPTPCVGREQELSMLELTLATCVEEPTAQAVLVVAPPGTGKSRLRHEFVRRVERRGLGVQVLQGRGDPMSAGSPWGLLGQALRRLCGIADGEQEEARRERLHQRLARHLPQAHAWEVVAFLGELCGVPFDDEQSPRLRAARGDPQLMSTQVARALVSWLQAECAHHPVLLVLEDLHWGDALTVALVEEVLKALAEQPLMVLALARPEVKELLPGPWLQRMQEVPLRGLSRKAGARLVREVLGAEVPDSLVERLVEQAAGNALFLEELIRTAAEGKGEELPGTVLAMLQARLMRLGPELRQVLLAGSMIGRSFWCNGVRALLGTSGPSEALERHLRRLEELEVVERQAASRFPAEAEYRFRHALLRDAAYALVPDSHRPRGHRLAGAWLEQVGESDPLVLAEHARLGQQPERAMHYYTLAAEQLYERHDMQGMARYMEATRALGPTGEALVRLQALQATAAFWMDDFVTTYEVGLQVLPALKAGSPRWCKLLVSLSLVAAQSGHREYTLDRCRLLLSTEPEEEALPAYLVGLCLVGSMCSYLGAPREVEACFERLEEKGRVLIPQDGFVRGWWSIYHAFRSMSEGRPWEMLARAEQAVQSFREVGAERELVPAYAWWGHALAALGDVAGAVERMREGLGVAVKIGQGFAIAFARHQLSQALVSSPEPAHREEARALARGVVEARIPNLLHLGMAHGVLAHVAASEGDVEEALAQARWSCEVLAQMTPFLTPVRRLLSALLLVAGEVDEALQVAQRGLEEATAAGCAGIAGVGLLVAQAEAHLAQGDRAAAEQALHKALHSLHSRAGEIADPATRARFLHHVPDHARALSLAEQYLGHRELPG